MTRKYPDCHPSPVSWHAQRPPHGRLCSNRLFFSCQGAAQSPCQGFTGKTEIIGMHRQFFVCRQLAR